MKKASNVLLIVTKIVCWVCMPVCFLGAIASIVCMCIPEFKDALIQVFQENNIEWGSFDAATLANMVIGSMGACAFFFVVLGVLCIVTAIIAGKAMNNPRRDSYIACIVLGVFTTFLAILGGVFGLIGLGQEARRQSRE